MKKVIYLLFAVLISSCTDKSKNPPTDQLNHDQLAQRGKSIYNLNCIACHNTDPNKEGTAGPALKSTSKELLEARLLRASYPAGYKPKRDTKQMPALPHLEKEIEALEAFLR